MTRLSLIIATYNRSAWLLRALESVVTQTAPRDEWECIVVDNNSTDDTAARFAEFAASHASFQLRLVHESRQGLSHARNCGIEHSRGEYIAIIDDDECICPDFISAYTDLFDRHPEAGSAGGRIIARYPAGRPAWMSRWTEQAIANPIDLGDKIREFPAGCIPGGGNMALRRATIERGGLFDTSLGRSGASLTGGEESDLFARLARMGVKCLYVPRAVMYHIIPPEKLTDDYFDRLYRGVGATQRLRAEAERRVARAFTLEIFKWIATAAIAACYAATLKLSRAAYVVRMRRRISQGLFSKK